MKKISLIILWFISSICYGGAFLAEQSCRHAQRIAQLRGQDQLPQLLVGEVYTANEYNNTRREFIRIDVPGYSQPRWVRSDCGIASGSIRVNGGGQSQATMRSCSADSAPGEFEYYKLAISYSREFCNASNNDQMDQCQRPWVVHGLWPQNTSCYPSECQVPQQYRDPIAMPHLLTFMPSEYIVNHEWDVHGTCSGLFRSDYFVLTEDLYKQLQLPEIPLGTYTKAELYAFIIQPNQSVGLTVDMIELACDENGRKPDAHNDTLDEIRICFNKQGVLRACANKESSCDHNQIRVRGLYN